MKETCYFVILLFSFQLFYAEQCPRSCQEAYAPECPLDCYCIVDGHYVLCAGHGSTTIPYGVLPTGTKVLQFQDYNVSSMHYLLYIRMPELDILGMSHNRINDTESLNYIYLPKLSVLELQHNILTSFDFHVLGRFMELTVVDLRHNYIKELNLDYSQSKHYSLYNDIPQENSLQSNVWHLAVDPDADNWLIRKKVLLEVNPIDCCLSKRALLEYSNIFFGNCSLPFQVQGLSFQEAIPKVDCGADLQESKTVNKANVVDTSNSQLLLLVVYDFALTLLLKGE